MPWFSSSCSSLSARQNDTKNDHKTRNEPSPVANDRTASPAPGDAANSPAGYRGYAAEEPPATPTITYPGRAAAQALCKTLSPPAPNATCVKVPAYLAGLRDTKSNADAAATSRPGHHPQLGHGSEVNDE